MSAVPTVSVLLTTYNREKYVAAAIESVLSQTFGDFELLIADDQSTDATVPIARAYEKSDTRVRVIVNQANLGQFRNRNRAAGLARGVFLKYHDSDDFMYPHCLMTMVTLLAAEPRASFALSNGWCWPGGPCPMLLTPRMCYQREFLGFGLFMCGPSGALFRTESFAALGGFPERGVGSDYLFWLSICARVNVLLVPADLFWYRIHSQQELHTEHAAQEYALLLGEAWRAIHSSQCPLLPEEREQAKRNIAFSLLKHTYRDVRSGRWGVATRRLRAAALSWRDWLRYLRPPRRTALAGTPLDENGDYLVSAWTQPSVKVGG